MCCQVPEGMLFVHFGLKKGVDFNHDLKKGMNSRN